MSRQSNIDRAIMATLEAARGQRLMSADIGRRVASLTNYERTPQFVNYVYVRLCDLTDRGRLDEWWLDGRFRWSVAAE